MRERDSLLTRTPAPAAVTATTTTSTQTASSGTMVLEGRSKKRGLGRILPFLGPAFIACIAYMDPGNFATNISAGAQFGYLLVWVIVVSNLMAMLIQSLSAKLGIATGSSLPEVCREHFAPPVVIGLWLFAELVAIATDLAEFLGAALGFNLLFHIPLLPAGLITAIATFLILGLERYGFRPMEAVITAMVGIIALCYILETVLGKPDFGQVGRSFLPPKFDGTESVLLAVGILGATVMPHVIYLHSALTQHRITPKTADEARRLFRFEVLDVGIAMGIAGFVNVAMLLMAAATFNAHGFIHIDAIVDAHKTLEPILGSSAGVIFAVSLVFSGLSSSAVGTMSGQIIMQGFLHRHIPIWVRRLVTIAPSIFVIAVGLNATRTLIISQVVLSFGIPFALVPLVLFTRRRDIMGALVNRPMTTALISLVAGVIIALNIFLLQQTFFGS
ncbi:MAG TPA: Nramp family divalent metal transporter [Thermomicrobiales bacterium]